MVARRTPPPPTKVELARQAKVRQLLRRCAHPSHYVPDQAGRMARCPCWVAAMALKQAPVQVALGLDEGEVSG